MQQKASFIDFKHQRLDNIELRAEQFYDTMKRRRTIRHFSDEPVARSVIEHVLLTAGSAPNGAHMQPWHFVAVSSAEVKKQIRQAAEKEEEINYNGRLGPQ